MIPVAAIVRFAPWILVGIALGGALWYRGEYHDCQAAREADRAAAEQAKAAALEDAQRRSDTIIAEQARALAETAARAGEVRERIIRVPVTTACAGSDAVRLGIDGLRGILGSAGGGPAKAE